MGRNAPHGEPRRTTARLQLQLGRSSFEALRALLRSARLAPQDDGAGRNCASRAIPPPFIFAPIQIVSRLPHGFHVPGQIRPRI